MKKMTRKVYELMFFKWIFTFFLMITILSVHADVLEQVSEITEGLSEELDQNENSTEGKDYKKNYEKRTKEEERKLKEQRRNRVSCILCPIIKSVELIILRELSSSFPHNDYLYFKKNLKEIRFYNAIHLGPADSIKTPRLERTYGINHKDTVSFSPKSRGYRVLVENHNITKNSIFNYYTTEEIFFYTSGKFFIKIHVFPKALHKKPEISLYEDENYTGLSELEFQNEEFEIITNISYKSSSKFFDGDLIVDAEMSMGTDVYKGTVTYNWVDKYFGNFVFEGDNENRYSIVSTNFGTDDRFSLGFKAIFINKLNSSTESNPTNILTDEDTYYLEANYGF